MTRKQHVTLSVEADTVFLKLATSFVENSATAFGMDYAEALALTLAAEEIFSYLCQSTAPHQDLEIRCFGGGYYVQVQFLFEAQDFNMRSFNLPATAFIQDEANLGETGLLIASRMVDRFDLSAEYGEKHRLTLTKEKTYPGLAETDLPEIEAMPRFRLKAPEVEETKLFARLVRRNYADQILPPFFSFPGKVADMVVSGEYHAIVARHDTGKLGGGMLWRMGRHTIVECYGPYVFGPNAGTEMAAALVDSCIEGIARTEAAGLINRYPSRDLPEGYFEELGTLRFSTDEHCAREIPVLYRQLVEDAGAAVWSHPDLEQFLRDEYQRLCLARQILPVHSQGETSAAFSVLSAEFDRPNRQVTLNPVLSGADADHNLARHVEILKKEGLTSILFLMDLGKPWQSDFVPALLKHDFEPRVIMPYAGNRDLVIFQLKTGDLPE